LKYTTVHISKEGYYCPKWNTCRVTLFVVLVHS